MNRRIGAIMIFALLALAEIGDLIGLIMTLADPAEPAKLLGITPRAEAIRAIVLIALALLIAMNALIALVGALRRSAFVFQFGALMTGIALVSYGLYQILSAAFQLGNMPLAGVGLAYAALGALALRFARTAPSVVARAGT